MERVAGARNDELADVGQRLYRSLQTERMHLVRLSASLARADEDATDVFQELVLRAHQLHTSATILEIAELAGPADSLEQAAIRASKAHAANSDPCVWAALAALVNQIGAIAPGRAS
jgi:HPt (histidine-containing phosphotransfer) domain-containing protein